MQSSNVPCIVHAVSGYRILTTSENEMHFTHYTLCINIVFCRKRLLEILPKFKELSVVKGECLT